MISVGKIHGMTVEDEALFRELLKEFNNHESKNAEKQRYYEGAVTLGEVNLGIALPANICGLEIGCEWGAKAVDVLASRSMFDGYVGKDGGTADQIKTIADRNALVSGYMKACKDELKFGCAFATLSKDMLGNSKIRFHSPMTATARWNGELGRIDGGFAIVAFDQRTGHEHKPVVINFYTDNMIYVMERVVDTDEFSCVAYPHKMGRPLMEPLVWNPTSAKPFGRSRLKYPIRNLIKGYVRTIANATIGLEFSTTPQKYLLGVTDEQFDAIVSDKFRQYVGSILTSTSNPETGEKPSFGQLPQGTIQPHIEMMRLLATQFSAASGLNVTDVGVVNDANPTSSDAILAQTQTLILMAEQLNAGNTNALTTIALMALAIEQNTTIEELDDEAKDIVPHFKNPAMPSVSVTADAALKIASARQGFANTDVFLEMLGFSQADIRRIKAQEVLVRGMNVLEGLEA